MAAKLTDQERQAILADIQAGELSRNAIAKKHGRSVGTITNVADQAGLNEPFDRSATENATRARSADLAEVRSQTSARLLRMANELLDRVGEECTVYSFGGAENRYAEHVLEKPPSVEVRNFMTAAAIALDKHVVLDKHDTDDSSGAAVDAWLRSVMGRGETAI